MERVIEIGEVGSRDVSHVVESVVEIGEIGSQDISHVMDKVVEDGEIGCIKPNCNVGISAQNDSHVMDSVGDISVVGFGKDELPVGGNSVDVCENISELCSGVASEPYVCVVDTSMLTHCPEGGEWVSDDSFWLSEMDQCNKVAR